MQTPLPVRPRLLDTPEKAGRHDARTRNQQLTLQIIADQGTTSRAEVSRLTGLTRATVSSIVGDLIAIGLVREAGLGVSAGGKPPTLIELKATGRSIVVLDLGRWPFVGMVADLRGKILLRMEATDVQRGSDSSATAITLAQELVRSSPSPVLGIGVAAPGVVNDRGTVVEAPSLGWRNVEIGDCLRMHTGLPVLVANDSNAAAVAVQRRLPQPNHEVLVVNMNSGIGGGIILDGKLHLGTHRAAGEIGHTIVDSDGKGCGCGNRGCLETIASSPAIRLAATGSDPTDGGEPDWDADVLSGVYGHEQVHSAIAEAGHRIGEVAAGVVNMLDISQVVLWTMIKNSSETFVESINATLVPNVMPAMRSDVTVSVTNDSDLLSAGAVALVLASELGLKT